MAEDWNGHTVSIKLAHGGGMDPVVEFKCKEGDKDTSPCMPGMCQMEETYSQVGWEVFKAAGDIPLANLSARMDWSDPEEPWIEVEP